MVNGAKICPITVKRRLKEMLPLRILVKPGVATPGGKADKSSTPRAREARKHWLQKIKPQE